MATARLTAAWLERTRARGAVVVRTKAQEEFAAEQAEQNARLDALHRALHPERYDAFGNPARR